MRGSRIKRIVSCGGRVNFFISKFYCTLRNVPLVPLGYSTASRIPNIILNTYKKNMYIYFYKWTFFVGKHTVYRMSAATAEEKDEWTKCLK